MGVMPQTAANGLKPFGLLYSLVMSNQIPVAWAINPNKVTDKNPPSPLRAPTLRWAPKPTGAVRYHSR